MRVGVKKTGEAEVGLASWCAAGEVPGSGSNPAGGS